MEYNISKVLQILWSIDKWSNKYKKDSQFSRKGKLLSTVGIITRVNHKINWLNVRFRRVAFNHLLKKRILLIEETWGIHTRERF